MKTLAETGFKLPVRVAHIGVPGAGSFAIVGTKGAYGDAGWSVVDCTDLQHAQQIMRSYPGARMPCWRRFEVAS